MDIAFSLSQRVSLITPARYLFNAGKTPREWNQKIHNDIHFKVVWYKANSTEVFPNVDIKGGVAVMYRDSQKNFGKIGHYTAFAELNSIYKKVVDSIDFKPFSSIIYSQNKFNFNALYQEFPFLRGRIGSNGRERRLTTSIFSITELFLQESQNQTDLKMLGLVNNNRVYRWVRSDIIEQHPCLEKYKVIVPKSNGSGTIGEILSTPLIGEPLIGVTQSFIQIGAFNTRIEAEACLKYIKTRFARTLLGTLKATQHNPRDTWAHVPLLDYTSESNVDWTQSVADIDRQLYRMYGLSEMEINFIEEKVKKME